MENMWENTLGTWGTYWEPDGKHGRLPQIAVSMSGQSASPLGSSIQVRKGDLWVKNMR